MNRVVHFEIQADDPARARTFYAALFGWTFEQFGQNDYWLIRTGPAEDRGIDGGLLPRHGVIDGTAVIGYVCTVDVDNLDAKVTSAVAHGAQIALPKMAIPHIGWLAYCKDTEGNVFGMMQNDPKAA